MSVTSLGLDPFYGAFIDGKFDIDAQIVRIQFQLVPRPQTAVFRHVHRHRRDRPIER